ncbi:MAG: DNA-directed RNA polymerase subunit D [Nanoarchaeota archaeon]
MKLETLHSDKYNATFVLSGVTPAYINTLRRLVINKVPAMAVEEVTFIENGSALYDEILAHRIGLIPLHTDLKTYNLPAECKCKGAGCARCQVKMTLNKAGPCIVTAELIKTKDPEITPVFPKMPIVKLFEGQTLKLEMTANLGFGKDHIKYTPGMVYFRGYPVFKIKENKDAKACVDACPKKILKLDGKKLKVTDEAKCDLCKACVDACPEAIQVEGSKDEFIVNIESWGQLSAKQIMTTAMELFDTELDELEKEIKAIK